MAVINIDAFNFLYLQQEITSPWIQGEAENTLIFNQLLTSNYWYASAFNTLGFNSGVGGTVRYVRNIFNHLQFRQNVNPMVTNANIFQNLFISQYLSRMYTAENFINFAQQLTFSAGPTLGNQLGFQGVVTAQVIYNRPVLQSLNFISTATGYVADQTCILDVPGLTRPTAVTLTYGSLSVTLPGPDFDNNDKISYDRINRTTRGGDLLIARDPEWPVEQVLIYQWSSLKQKHINEILPFMKASLGQIITIHDYTGNTYNGVIRTPASEASQPGRFEYTLHLEFELQ